MENEERYTDEWNRRSCPFWVKRAMARIEDMEAPSSLASLYGRMIVNAFMEEAAKDGVSLDETETKEGNKDA